MMPFEDARLFKWAALHSIAKSEVYALAYGAIKPVQQRIDDEGCGAVICAARLVPD